MKTSKLLFISLLTSGLLLTGCGSSSKQDESGESEETTEEAPVIDTGAGTVKYGLYPQTVVTDADTIAALDELDAGKKEEANGWFLYNEQYYAKINKAAPFVQHYSSHEEGQESQEEQEETEEDETAYVFNNGNKIITDNKYWFVCEPIQWRILHDNENGTGYILSEFLLDTHSFHISPSARKIDGEIIYSNNYEYSDIRSWLNKDFLNTAFFQGQKYIQTTLIDNSETTTGVSGEDEDKNPYACNDTTEKVYLPSYADYLNNENNFPDNADPSATRMAEPTDYARAKGAYYCQDLEFQYKGFYWTRSPFALYSNVAYYVSADGSVRNDNTDEISGDPMLPIGDFSNSFIDRSYLGVRPSLTLKMN